jgi:hypothetical protein
MHSSFMIPFSLHVSVKIIKREGFFDLVILPKVFYLLLL